MDINKIFGLFESSSYDDLGIDALDQYDLKARIEFFDKYREHPVVWLGMFHKLVNNYNIYNKTLLNTFKTTFLDFNINDVNDAGEFIIYNKAYEFIRKIDVERDLDFTVLKNNSNIKVLQSLNYAILYFEDIEEYEKCSFLVKIKNIVEKNLT
jgi:hypothetical protein